MEETLETMQARHRKELKDLQSRITNKKKNATKKTRKGVNDECAALERELKERQGREMAVLNGEVEREREEEEEQNDEEEQEEEEGGDITERIKKVTFAATTTPEEQPSQGQQQQQQQQGNKKRNRQKERMARRAAEQALATEAAALEASQMPDRRTIERSALEKTFEENGLSEHEIRPDGHCLFAAVADQLEQRNLLNTTTPTPTPIPTPSSLSSSSTDKEIIGYRAVRRTATEYMSAHAEDFAPFIDEPLETYIPKIRDTAEWGGQVELLALASAYRVEIRVVQNGRTETIQPREDQEEQQQQDKEKDQDRTIWLAYYRHGYGLGEHYNSLRTKELS
ncbi:hypothetical protein GGS20DRAFT_25255 [Poronia punctata]|nr:hypothetical protein GGS20DRAFT_25255 [Poronia punctata]